uniref:Uncharacterized protein n=1 Tax=Rhizophora mucronata TaxID=61149 RepID=A0A2P2N9B4_RHIMU
MQRNKEVKIKFSACLIANKLR